MIAKAIKSYFHGIRCGYFWPNFIIHISIAACLSVCFITEDIEVRRNFVKVGFIELAIWYIISDK